MSIENYKEINRQQQYCKQLVYISLDCIIRDVNKISQSRQRDTERIQSVLCEVTLRMKRIIVL